LKTAGTLGLGMFAAFATPGPTLPDDTHDQLNGGRAACFIRNERGTFDEP
jgi:hypothetical protein